MVYSVRMKCGKQLAIEAPIHLANKEMDASKVIVAPIPETSTPAALGFAEQVSVYLEKEEVLFRITHHSRFYIVQFFIR